MAKCTISGTVHKLEDVQVLSEKFSKRIVRVEEVSGKGWREIIPVEFCNDRIDLLSNVAEGDFISVEADIGGREWKDKCFLSAKGWRITHESAQDAPNAQTNTNTRAEPATRQTNTQGDEMRAINEQMNQQADDLDILPF